MPDQLDPNTVSAQMADWTQFLIAEGSGYITSFLLAILILVVGWLVAGWTRKLITAACARAKLDMALARFLALLGRYAVLAMTIIATLATVGVETTSFVAVLASIGFAVGMALQGSLGHLASGVMILVFRPFTLGDRVQVGGSTGVVEDIGLFATTLHTADNTIITVPNGSITGGTITNYTRLGTLRASIAVVVAYGSDLKRVQEVCLAAARSVDEVLTEPDVGFAFIEMGASSINFNLMPWSTAANFLLMEHKVRSAVYDALNAEGIEIPFNQVVVHQAPTQP